MWKSDWGMNFNPVIELFILEKITQKTITLKTI